MPTPAAWRPGGCLPGARCRLLLRGERQPGGLSRRHCHRQQLQPRLRPHQQPRQVATALVMQRLGAAEMLGPPHCWRPTGAAARQLPPPACCRRCPCCAGHTVSRASRHHWAWTHWRPPQRPPCAWRLHGHPLLQCLFQHAGWRLALLHWTQPPLLRRRLLPAAGHCACRRPGAPSCGRPLLLGYPQPLALRAAAGLCPCPRQHRHPHPCRRPRPRQPVRRPLPACRLAGPQAGGSGGPAAAQRGTWLRDLRGRR
jgi:hypothetical protein